MAKAHLHGKGFADVSLEKTEYVNVVIILIVVRRIELFMHRNFPRRAIHETVILDREYIFINLAASSPQSG